MYDRSRPSGLSTGAGVFLVLITVYLLAILTLGRAFPEWMIGVGAAVIVSVSLIIGLAPARRSRSATGAGKRS